ncbi:MAG: hypothetical protein F6K60_28010 [Okeania sp. SIO1F9]|nr:hypothetical protein [Okeania sp. SIO1F9]
MTDIGFSIFWSKKVPVFQLKELDNIKSGSIGVIKPEFSATNGTGL